MDPQIAYPKELRESEEKLIATRRREAGADPGGKPIGIALSGGGIRSATFSLGVLQALAEAKLLRRVDYLSTVSGGGYIGASLGALYAREKLPAKWEGEDEDSKKPKPPRVDVVEGLLSDLGHDYLRWLREHGRYLSPNGAGDLLLAAAVLLRNWVAVQVTLAVALGCLLLLQLAIRLGLGATDGVSTWTYGAELVNGIYWHGIWWSPWVAAPVVPLLGAVIPSGWAYWLVLSREVYRPWLEPVLLVLFLLVCESLGLGLILWGSGEEAHASKWLWPLVAVILTTLLTLAWFWGASWLARKEGTEVLGKEERKARAQRWLSRALEVSLWWSTFLFAFGLVDSLGQSALGIWSSSVGFSGFLGVVVPVVGVIVSAAPTVISFFPSLSQDARPRSYVTAISTAAAAFLLFVFLIVVSSGAHAIAWRGEGAPSEVTGEYEEAVCRNTETDPCDPSHHAVPTLISSDAGARAIVVLAAFGIAAIVTLSIGYTWAFLNQSTHAPLYAARLRRAYVGASNPVRLGDARQSVRLEARGDELSLDKYKPDERGGPLHIVNVTINETIGAESQIEQRDRKGMNLAFGPGGVSAGVRHHATWRSRGKFSEGLIAVAPGDDRFQVFRGSWKNEPAAPFIPEALPIGRLVAISGAAFTTGLGARTSLAMSLVLGLLNIRLGHWWYSGVDPRWREAKSLRKQLEYFGWSRWFPVHRHLMNELLARFPGTARENWYLSDGGHFENTACYELIRRRVPFIIVCDNGEDPKCDLTDLGQLVRKARLDFGCEIHFLTQQEIERVAHPELVATKRLGTVQELSRVSGPRDSDPPRYRQSDVYATLAIARYKDGGRSVILWIKPGLNGSEPQDVIEYAVANGAFPQEPTADQFFDEAQWESYRKLGKWIGDSLFRKFGRVDPRWLPGSLDPDSLLALYGSD